MVAYELSSDHLGPWGEKEKKLHLGKERADSVLG